MHFNAEYMARLTPQPNLFGLRRESRRAGATPHWKLCPQSKSGVAAALCHRSPKSSRFSKILTDSSAKDAEKRRESRNAGLCESLRFSASSAFKNLRGLIKTIQTIESRARRQP
jgi:hypothetical protein